jgi:hypothetical protein
MEDHALVQSRRRSGWRGRLGCIPHAYASDGGYNQKDNANAVAFWDDIHISPSQARVEICESPTWAQCKDREIQPASSWNGTSITVKLNRGGLASLTKTYLYVVDENGAMNANGFPL